MKPTDLNFRVLTPTPEHAEKLLTATTKAGIERLHGQTDTPDGWWEVENGQPIWGRK